MLTKGVVYYTDCKLDIKIMKACQKQLLESFDGEIINISLKPMDFGKNIVLNTERGILTMFKQIFIGLENSKSDIIFLTEHDVLYHKTHFLFTPTKNNTFYYNTNVWKIRYSDGMSVWTDDLQQVSGCCAYKKLFLDFYYKKIKQMENGTFDRHYEPGLKQIIGSSLVENWKSDFPNLDIRHSNNLTKSKWNPHEFRNLKYAKGWKESNDIVGWGKSIDIIDQIKY